MGVTYVILYIFAYFESFHNKGSFLNTDRTQLTAHPLANKTYNFTHQISLCYLETPQCHLSKKIQGLLMSLKHKTFLSHYVNALELLRIYLSKE